MLYLLNCMLGAQLGKIHHIHFGAPLKRPFHTFSHTEFKKKNYLVKTVIYKKNFEKNKYLVVPAV